MDILRAMHDAKFVQVNGQTFVTGYSRDPEDLLVADDIVLEASSDGSELALTLDEVHDAEALGHGAYRLRSGAVLCFITPPILH
jgi:hypothetical protein